MFTVISASNLQKPVASHFTSAVDI